jgi:predicted RNA-binding protein associated with RNAse of E/G family
LAPQKFTEYKTTYFGKTQAFECTLAEKLPGEVVIAYEISKPMTFTGVTFPSGSKSHCYFWEQRNYNVYHWKNTMGKTIMFYFNIAKNTRILEDKVNWDDLIVDLEAFPDGREPMILDEDEVPNTISTDDRRLIDKTKAHILSHIRELTSELEMRTDKIIERRRLQYHS